jgi:hypothetical protein
VQVQVQEGEGLDSCLSPARQLHENEMKGGSLKRRNGLGNDLAERFVGICERGTKLHLPNLRLAAVAEKSGMWRSVR